MSEKIDTSDEACAMACVLVSNPQGALRQDGDGWQKQVNDLIRALRDERNDYRARMCKAIDELSYADLRASGGISPDASGGGAQKAAAAIEAIPAMQEAIEQALDDMGEDGHSVCEAAKQMLKDALIRAYG